MAVQSGPDETHLDASGAAVGGSDRLLALVMITGPRVTLSRSSAQPYFWMMT